MKRICTTLNLTTIITRKRGLKTYPDHVPTNFLQKIGLTVGSALMALSNPERGDMVAILGETTGSLALNKIYNRMAKDPIGRQILAEKPRVNTKTINVNFLRKLPEKTFGGAYIRWMDAKGFVADERAQVKFVDNPELAYVMQRYREIHDFWHILSGLDTSVLAEIAVKWFEMLQTGLPMNVLSAVVAPIRLSFSEQLELQRKYIPWAVDCSSKAVDLMNVYYEHHFEKDLEQFRKELNFKPFSM